MSFSSGRRLLLRGGITAVFLLPLLWVMAAALLPPGNPLPQRLTLWPMGATFANFQRIWQIVPFAQFMLNSLQVALLAVPLTVLTSSWAGFGMSQLQQSVQQRWVIVSLAVLMVPGIALWSSRFLLFEWLGWLDSIWALIAPAWMGTSAFYVLMFYRAYRRIPRVLFEAARLDGAGVLQLWALIGFPLGRATALGVALLSFIFYWGDFISPLLYLRSQSKFTLPVALQLMQQLNRSDWPLLTAAAMATAAIPIALFLLLQPYFSRLD